MQPQQVDPIKRLDDARFAPIPEEELPAMFKQAIIPREQLEQSRISVEYTSYLTIGGGIGSFIWVDNLVVRGVQPSQIVSIGMEAKPYDRYRRLCEQSQIPETERLRSDSGSTPDNIWGFPGYAVREAVNDVLSLRMKSSIKKLTRIFSEPLMDVYTPVSGHVYASIERESERINWSKISRQGRVHCIRQTDDGYYAVLYTIRKRDGSYAGRCLLARYIYVAVGYPGARVLPELKRLRQDHNHGIESQPMPAVNAYEDHDHIYKRLQRYGGTVVVRGRGIVASRILQRICESREMNQNIHIIHLMRKPVAEGSTYRGNTRAVASHWELQPYNFPKSSWGGHLQGTFKRANDDTRSQLLDNWGGTTTSTRQDWQNIIKRGQREGWYSIIFGNLTEMSMEEDEQLCICIETAQQQKPMQVLCDVIIDATGLDANLRNHPLLRDLVDTYDLPLNIKGRLDVSNDFELQGMRTSKSRFYAGGAMTMGGKYAPVDSFLGLQYCAQTVVAELTRTHAPSLRRLTPKRSLSQWFRWMMGVTP